MLKRLADIFGEEFWKHVVIGITRWKFTDAEIRDRGPKAESKKKAHWNDYFKDSDNGFYIDVSTL